jgi:hypothetical protein
VRHTLGRIILLSLCTLVVVFVRHELIRRKKKKEDNKMDRLTKIPTIVVGGPNAAAQHNLRL